MYTIQDLNQMLQKAIDICKGLNIPVCHSINPEVKLVKAHSFFGRCHKSNSYYTFQIQISSFTLDNTEKSIMNTMLHEVLHTCTGCFNHQSLWRSYAAKVNEAYDYNIQRCDGDKTAEDKFNLERRPSKEPKPVVNRHKLVCDSCGQVFLRTRNSRFTLHPEIYTCTCGGHITKIY